MTRYDLALHLLRSVRQPLLPERSAGRPAICAAILLLTMAKHPDRHWRATEIRAISGLEIGHISHYAGTLQSAGLIDRVPTRENHGLGRRRHTYRLTPAGVDYARALLDPCSGGR